MPTHYFRIVINSEDWLEYYRGKANAIQVISFKGLRIRIPAHHFIPFASQGGVYGIFKLELGSKSKFKSLTKIEVKQ